jgi:S-adenosylmethionine-dependent methyltransferase
VTTDRDRVRRYYARFAEWERLDAAEGALELRRACALIDAYLVSPGRVLDLGGGPGRYAIELARRGHRVVLADLSPELLQIAREKIAAVPELAGRVEAIDELDAVDLGRYADGTFDAVVAFGPLYHLTAEAERRAAAAEMGRVLRGGGLAFVAFLPRLSGIAGILERAASAPGQVPEGTLTAVVASGVFRNGDPASGFQEGYYPTPAELDELLERAGLAVIDRVSLRSIASGQAVELGRLPPAVAAEAEEAIERLARDPGVVATGGHAVAVARKR